VHFEGVIVPKSAVIGTLGTAEAALSRALMRATPILCAYQVGGAQAVFDMSVEYSRERQQFGQRIGRFQHVQNHIIQLVNYVDAARWTTYESLWRLDSAKSGAEVSVHLAKAVTSEGFVQAVNYAHEVHAGVGVMHEYGLTLYTRLSRELYHQLGSPKYHRRCLGDLLVDHDLGPDPLE
jgi:alkylation response protein AidB-like acyl-CoA dehydrogenase